MTAAPNGYRPETGVDITEGSRLLTWNADGAPLSLHRFLVAVMILLPSGFLGEGFVSTVLEEAPVVVDDRSPVAGETSEDSNTF